MRTAWNIIAIVALLNLLVLGGFVLWLVQSDRLDRARYDAIVAMLSQTVAQESLAQEEERKNEEALRLEQEKIAHLKQVEQGPITMTDRLSADQQADELAMHRLTRLQAEIASLRQGLDSQNRQLAMERQQLVEERQAFEAQRQADRDRLADEDFQRVVQTLEQIRPAQAKQMMQELLRQPQGLSQVVAYLAAMDLRKSAQVLREFKSPQEVAEATRIVEQLRLRRVESASTDSGRHG